MDLTTQRDFSTEAFEAARAAAQEPGWLRDSRRAAWRSFLEQTWPAREGEEWSRTDIRTFKLGQFSPQLEGPVAEPEPRGLLREGVELAGYLTSVNGRITAVELEPAWRRRGLLFGNLSELVVEHEALLRPYVEHPLVDPTYDRFSALRAACWTAGSLVYVPRGVAVDQPLHLLSVIGDGAADISQALLVLDEGAAATVLCDSEGLTATDAGLHCGGLDVIVRPGAHLRLVHLQNWGQRTWHFAHQKARVGRDASLQWTVAAMGSRLAKVNQHVELVGGGADAQVNGVLFTEGKQHIAYHTLQHHQAPGCHSDFLYKGALQDQSRIVWRGMIKVDPQARQTNGYQRNDNLMLGTAVRADSIPGLEIEADDVRCTHGSTTGRVDEELIFYARCRGFTRKEAIQAIVTGFFQQIFDRITIPSVRDALALAIGRRVREYT